PVGYLEYDGGELPASGLAAEGKDLLFWSHGYDLDMDVTGAICRQWPDAAFYEILDRARIGRLHGALLGGAPWWPRVADARCRASPSVSRATGSSSATTRSVSCPSAMARPSWTSRLASAFTSSPTAEAPVSTHRVSRRRNMSTSWRSAARSPGGRASRAK